MANPGYPPQMQPGMQPPGMMPMRPSGPGIPMAGAARKGTPKIVPIVVSAGLAVGVFCGLYFGLGTGETSTAEAGTNAPVKTGVSGPQSAAGATDEKLNFKSGEKPPSELGSGSAGSAAAPGSGTTATAGTPGTGSGTSTPPPGTGSGTTPPPGTGSGTTPPPAGEVTVTLSFTLTPPDAEVTVDGQDVTGGKTTIKFTGDTKTIRVTAKASGYKKYDKKLTLSKDTTEESLEITLGKKSSGPRPPHNDHHDSHDPPGGLIDL